MKTLAIQTELKSIESLISAKCQFDNYGNPIDAEYWLPIFDRQEELEEMLHCELCN